MATPKQKPITPETKLAVTSLIPKGENLELNALLSEEPVLGVFLYRKEATFPTKGDEEAACYDLYTALTEREEIVQFGEDNKPIHTHVTHGQFTLHPKSRALIPTGIKFDIPKGYEVKCFSRSGYSFKQGVFLCNSVGVVDSSYTGEVFIPVYNSTTERVVIENAQRVIQFQLSKVLDYTLNPTTKYDKKTERGEGGFGSTGV